MAQTNLIRWHQPRHPNLFQWLGLGGGASFLLHFAGLSKSTFEIDAKIIKDKRAYYEQLSDADLDDCIVNCKKSIRKSIHQSRKSRSLIRESVALLVEISFRTLHLRPSHAQILASLAMVNGHLIQLLPGEGKTLSIAMTAVIFSWRNAPCHVVTANEYLATRDAELMQPLFNRCTVIVSSITSETVPADLKNAYAADVVYATANQLLADFLRDKIVLPGADHYVTRRLVELSDNGRNSRLVMRGLGSVIIDEADSVLIDDAVTPLIISHTEDDLTELLKSISSVRDWADEFKEFVDYQYTGTGVESIHFTKIGSEKIKQFQSQLNTYWHGQNRLHELVKLTIYAEKQFIKDHHYIIRDGKIVIIDDNTGRAMVGRNWGHGVHQAIEAKEKLELTSPTKTISRMTFQEFFRHYHVLCGASGTLHGLDFELWRTYGVKTRRVDPVNRSQLYVMPKRLFRTKEEKFQALITEIAHLHAQSVPILIGTRRIRDSEDIAQALIERGIGCTVLNAKQHQYEASIISQAGVINAVTVATNMAGRGTDIHVGETAEQLGGLHVFMFEPHETARVDWQLFGRAGRQGAKGKVFPYISLEDDLLTRFMPKSFMAIYRFSLPQWLFVPATKMLIWIAQRLAQRKGMKQRQHLALVETQLRRQLSFVRNQ
jgi:preprotein translocase subunit SecA